MLGGRGGLRLSPTPSGAEVVMKYPPSDSPTTDISLHERWGRRRHRRPSPVDVAVVVFALGIAVLLGAIIR
jgi:hypothetical protein